MKKTSHIVIILILWSCLLCRVPTHSSVLTLEVYFFPRKLILETCLVHFKEVTEILSRHYLLSRERNTKVQGATDILSLPSKIKSGNVGDLLTLH